VKNFAAALFLFGIAGSPAMAQEAQTLKERLSDKASDEQRVDIAGCPSNVAVPSLVLIVAKNRGLRCLRPKRRR
jgi:hypothetical protein